MYISITCNSKWRKLVLFAHVYKESMAYTLHCVLFADECWLVDCCFS
jgi:hypothetical protein